jgi:transposase
MDSRIGFCSDHCVTGIREPDMLTGMTERDWSIVLEVFDAAQSSRGEPGHDDRKFLEAIHYFTVHSITWRALPSEYGKWNSVWKRFWRLSRSGVFEAFFQMLAECSQTAHLIQFFDSTTARAHVSAAGAKGGQQHQALGRSRGGFSTKIHLKTDLDGMPLDFHLTGGEASDSTQFETSLDIGPDIRPRIAITDKGYDSQANRTAALARGITPVIPRRENSKQRGRFFPKPLYKLRARIEQTIGKLKRFKRVAMRCEKTDISYSAIISFACGLTLVKSVHTA